MKGFMVWTVQLRKATHCFVEITGDEMESFESKQKYLEMVSGRDGYELRYIIG